MTTKLRTKPKCPKCHSILFRDVYSEIESHFCIFCGVSGTLREIARKVITISQTFYETIPSFKCAVCGNKVKVTSLIKTIIDEKEKFVCEDCKNHQNDFI